MKKKVTKTKSVRPIKQKKTATMKKAAPKKVKAHKPAKTVKTVKAVRITKPARPTKTAVKRVSESKPTVVPRKIRAELWVYDEYGQGSIVANGDNLQKMTDRARQFINEANVENALAAGEKHKAWEAYYPEIFEKNAPSTSMYYAGNKRDGKHYVYTNANGSWSQIPLPKEAKMRFFLGTIQKGRTKEDWYLSDHRGNEINSLNDNQLQQKSVLFIKITG